jgi:hypothetical protein
MLRAQTGLRSHGLILHGLISPDFARGSSVPGTAAADGPIPLLGERLQSADLAEIQALWRVSSTQRRKSVKKPKYALTRFGKIHIVPPAIQLSPI